MFENLVEILKANPRKIVYTEGPDARILESAARLKKEGFLTPILVGNVEEVKAAAAKGGFDIEGLEILDPATYPGMEQMVQEFVALRKGKATEEEARAALLKGNYFGTMLVKMGVADALLGGATYSTADTVRPALQLVKTKPGAHLVSSCFILVRETGDEALRKLCMGDCAINISYEDSVDKAGNVTVSAPQKLAEVAAECAKTAKIFGMEAPDLNSFLKDRGIICKVQGQWQLTRQYLHMDLTERRWKFEHGHDGRRRLKSSLVWTERGREFILDLARKG